MNTLIKRTKYDIPGFIVTPDIEVMGEYETEVEGIKALQAADNPDCLLILDSGNIMFLRDKVPYILTHDRNGKAVVI